MAATATASDSLRKPLPSKMLLVIRLSPDIVIFQKSSDDGVKGVGEITLLDQPLIGVLTYAYLNTLSQRLS